MGDYAASAFYRFAKRGHRFKCWECGVKKKAPCGDTERADLPWCCHRRLGTYLPIVQAVKDPNTSTFTLQGMHATADQQGRMLQLTSLKACTIINLLPLERFAHKFACPSLPAA